MRIFSWIKRLRGRPQTWAWGLAVAAAVILLTSVLVDWTLVRHRRDHHPRASQVLAPGSLQLTSDQCRRCHEEIYAAWAGSDHAQAHRPVDAQADAGAFQPPRRLTVEGVDYEVGWHEGKPSFAERRTGRPDDRYTADYVLGYRPLRQYIVPVGGGHYQAAELAYDPAKQEWFNVFGGERRQPGEWGQWRGRGMNWNSMCAHCHVTDFRKNYDAAADTYASTWLEHGVGCVQCHGGVTQQHLAPGYRTANVNRQPVHQDPHRMMETCAPCHVRNELLTGVVMPGVRYADYYRVTLPVQPGIFYPDGQVRDEDFNYTSLLISRMGGKAGVTCLDCHDPHSGRTRLPANNNALCLQCHGAPGRLNAPAIDPTAHSHHAADSPGNRCVECHMPATTYMQRDPRHDHGFLSPDPLLTRELGIPNACTRCHQDKTTDWEIEAIDRWYGAKMESRQRRRARVVAAAQNGASAGAQLAELIGTEDIPAWKAALLLLGVPYVGAEPRLAEAARAALADADPLVRSAAVQALSPLPGEHARLRPLLRDPVRVVRLDAEWALSPELPAGSPERKELDACLAAGADQPAGQLRIGQDLFNRGLVIEAEAPLRRAIAWDPNSPASYESLGIVLDRQGRPEEAGTVLWRAAHLNPEDAMSAYQAGLAFAAARRLAEAEQALREATRRDPRFDRAWYNLGLLLSQRGQPREAVAVLQQAETLAPDVADYPYARATVLWQLGDRAGAEAAARRALQLDPAYAPARRLLEGK
ncbi:MAG: tetratricopeptide repeat protein [Opitutaceae bacterium]|nr:tetratricopeptide repeat protein [Opitutaceae bacterium]